jgi:alpha-1,3-rhamnosyltransferase
VKPLVTIAVTTYNSAVFIIETLESIYNQTYENLALVVSDDASKDDTIAKINDWIAQEKVKNRFQSIEVISVSQNTGVSANCNRCIAALPSDWFKFIAGDDILLPNCIQDNMDFAHQNSKAHIIFSQVKLYQDKFKEAHYIKTTPQDYPTNLMGDSSTASDQYRLLLISDRIHYTPSFFSNKIALLAVGGYDESNRLVEDYPMWLKLTKAGERLYYFHKKTVGYRIHAKATNNTGDDVVFKPSVLNAFVIRKKFAHPFLPWEIAASEHHVYRVSKVFQAIGWNKKSKITNTAYRIGCFYLNPFHYIYSFKKRMSHNKSNPFYY